MAKRKRSPKRVLLIVIGVVAALAIVATTLFLLRPRAATARNNFPSAKATRSNQRLSVTATGTIAPRDQANLNFAVGGTVDGVRVKVGQKVAKGQALASVKDGQLSDAVDLAAANLEAARAQLSQVLDNSDSTDAQITAARAQVNSADARLASAQNDLADATLTSPIAGTVAAINIATGDRVAASASVVSTGTSVTNAGGASGTGTSQINTGSGTSATAAHVVVISTGAWKVNATVGTADLPLLAAGQSVTIIPVGTTRTIAGTVGAVGIMAGQTTGGPAQFPVTVNVNGNPGGLYAGADADIAVSVKELTGVLTVPTAAVHTENGQSVVHQRDGNAIVSTPVKLGRVFGDATEITSGLREGDEVLLDTASPTPR